MGGLNETRVRVPRHLPETRAMGGTLPRDLCRASSYDRGASDRCVRVVLWVGCVGVDPLDFFLLLGECGTCLSESSSKFGEGMAVMLWRCIASSSSNRSSGSNSITRTGGVSGAGL